MEWRSDTNIQCYKRSRESSCVYSEKGLRYNAARQKADSMRDKIDRLEIFVNRIKDARGDVDTRSDSSAKQDVTGDSVNPEDTSPLIGNLRLSDSGATQYVGPGHWESVIEDVRRCKGVSLRMVSDAPPDRGCEGLFRE